MKKKEKAFEMNAVRREKGEKYQRQLKRLQKAAERAVLLCPHRGKTQQIDV